MSNWKADLDALVKETMALTKSVRVGSTMPRAAVEPNRMTGNLNRSERDEIRQRLANFKAHQSASRVNERTSQSSVLNGIKEKLRN
jgi:hypothetical protein